MSQYATMEKCSSTEMQFNKPPRGAIKRAALKQQTQVFFRGMSDKIRGAASSSVKVFGQLGRHMRSSAKGAVGIQMNRWVNRVLEPYL
ncbi:hypothetical protein TNCV_2004401 [Trichonephila clavipes]|nr:hypothetical protein TNCV_2004401 [Trichonephila clavipes]